jgi:hypothetical protein
MTGQALKLGRKVRVAHFVRESEGRRVQVWLWVTWQTERDGFYTVERLEDDSPQKEGKFSVNSYADKGAALAAFRSLVSLELPEILR